MVDFGFETEGLSIVEHFSNEVRGKAYLITGPSPGGIGAETAISLAHASPAMLILVGRSKTKCQSCIDAIHEVDPSVRVKFIETDLASLSSVKQSSQTILQDPEIPPIDALFNNAAVMMCPLTRTPDGFELQFATSHLGHFLLTNTIIPKLAFDARIVNVASSGNKMASIQWSDPNFTAPNSYDAVTAYGQSKTANILFSVALNARGLRAYAPHPGSIRTGLQKYITPELGRAAALRVLGDANARTTPKTLQQGCATMLRAALDPALVKEEGVFLSDCRIENPEGSAFLSAYAVDGENAERLWKLSEELVGQEFRI